MSRRIGLGYQQLFEDLLDRFAQLHVAAVAEELSIRCDRGVVVARLMKQDGQIEMGVATRIVDHQDAPVRLDRLVEFSLLCA